MAHMIQFAFLKEVNCWNCMTAQESVPTAGLFQNWIPYCIQDVISIFNRSGALMLRADT